MNKIIQGDCLEEMKKLEDDSIDMVLTDPPYGISFMGKNWDKAVPPVSIWKECFRVLKSGSFCFVMSSPRQDVLSQIIVRLTAAGFKMDQTPIYWTYACLSEDTEVYTKKGWIQIKHLHKSSKDDILVYDEKRKEYYYRPPTDWHSYKISEYMYRIKSKKTDQLVSRNHRVYTKQGFKFAEDIEEQEDMVYLSDLPTDICDIPGGNKETSQKSGNVLYSKLQTKNSSSKGNSIQQDTQTSLDRRKETKGQKGDDWRKKQGMERGSYIQKKEGKLCESIDKICEVSRKIFINVKERWIRYGTSIISGKRNKPSIDKNRNSTSYKSQCRGQQDRELNAIQDQQGSQKIRKRTEYKTTLATVTKEFYDGIISCPTVSTGCFVARRNGKIFITGNSGFPKGMNISKAIDKRFNAEREVVCRDPKAPTNSNGRGLIGNDMGSDRNITIPSTDQAKEFDGWYSYNPKPAVEVVLVCQKPLSEKSYIDQALKWYEQENKDTSPGCVNIDDCRIPTDEIKEKNSEIKGSHWNTSKNYDNQKRTSGSGTDNPKGRYPANLLVQDDILNDGIRRKSQGGLIENVPESANVYGKYGVAKTLTPKDSGSYSRYFDLDKWAEENGLSEKQKNTFPFLICSKPSGKEKGKECNHPTVKPLKLFQWLITLASRKEDIILDPYAGSGTTGVACINTNRQYILIEKEKEYINIIEARLKNIEVQEELF